MKGTSRELRLRSSLSLRHLFAYIESLTAGSSNHGLLHQTPVESITHRGTPELGGELRNTSVRCNLTTLRLPHRFHQRPSTQRSMRLFFIISLAS